VLKLIKILLSPTVILYSFIVKTRNLLFDKGFLKIKKVPAKIISVGNITVGGSGKTPAVVYLTSLLKRNEIKVGVLSRGYGRATKGYVFVSDGHEVKVNVNKGGDEIILAAEESSVPAAVSENRVTGANKFLKDVALDAIVLDDAFQHRWIHRNVDLVIFDQRFLKIAGRLEQKLLPLGVMREPFSSLDRANIIVINRKFSEKIEMPEKLKKYFDGKKVYYAYYKATGFYDVKNHKFYDVDEFQGQKSLVVCGVANPHSFYNILRDKGVSTTNKLQFADHKKYTNKEVQLIRKKFYDTNAYSVLTTQKDAVKLTNYSLELDDIDIYYLKIELAFEEKEKFDNNILELIK